MHHHQQRGIYREHLSILFISLGFLSDSVVASLLITAGINEERPSLCGESCVQLGHLIGQQIISLNNFDI